MLPRFYSLLSVQVTYVQLAAEKDLYILDFLAFLTFEQNEINNKIVTISTVFLWTTISEIYNHGQIIVDFKGESKGPFK